MNEYIVKYYGRGGTIYEYRTEANSASEAIQKMRRNTDIVTEVKCVIMVER